MEVLAARDRARKRSLRYVACNSTVGLAGTFAALRCLQQVRRRQRSGQGSVVSALAGRNLIRASLVASGRRL
ncbi:hypothetical protein LMG29739_05958 [Paraburkholderia solisilvae]|uniref:Uncharacterized protein n=1 Tax=Paraburkholderia solisilvae TaxID=624376 RepID=A0A6J5F1D5_9BURK|nr:hypothetical protein LMG29739_05958 [Paraburkholderia solisilvae]